MRDTGAGRADPLIIRRSEAADLDYATTGVWKIAYADFMTAMMAFFLVMWLVNATSDTTKTGIANYFNPIKLSDGTDLPRKGLRDPSEAVAGVSGDEAEFEGKQGSRRAADRQRPGASSGDDRRDAAMDLRDPYAVLAALARQSSAGLEADDVTSQNVVKARSREKPDTPAYLRDPFGPPVASVSPSAHDKPPATQDSPGGGAQKMRLAGQGSVEIVAREDRLASEARPSSVGDPQPASDREATRSSHDHPAGDPARTLLSSTSVREFPEVTVRDGDDGVLISLSDHAQFGMFAIGSAEPLPETVEIMEKVAALLGEVPGRVIISGHTDGRPFRSNDHGNWQLSAARAQMAYRMLVRGGLDEARVIRIEGHADRDLKVPEDPAAAENRRIEILVEKVPS